jgi:prepilin-type processing-associated H-X9-DG protein
MHIYVDGRDGELAIYLYNCGSGIVGGQYISFEVIFIQLLTEVIDWNHDDVYVCSSHTHACRNTRTCIHSPGSSPLDPAELPSGALSQILNGANILYLDGRLADTALLLGKLVLY